MIKKYYRWRQFCAQEGFIYCRTAILTAVFITLVLALVFMDLTSWAEVACACLSATSTVILGTVSIVQNKKAEETNKRLARINQDQLEATIVNSNYPLIKFCDLQRIEKEEVFVFRFFDIGGLPIKKLCTRRIIAVPLADEYKNEETRKEIALRKEEKTEPLRFTFNHDNSTGGFYMFKVPSKGLFDGFRYCRVELEMELISATGVVTKNKGYILLDSESHHDGMNGREYPYVYHQFFEIEEVLSEQKYLTKARIAQKNH